MSVFNTARKYRIYPNEEQIQIIEHTFGCCRFVWNKLLGKASETYFDPEQTFHIVNYGDIVHEYQFLNDKELIIDRDAVSRMRRFLNIAFTRFFDKWKDIKLRKFRKDGKPEGFPHFKSKNNPVQSYTNMNIKNHYKHPIINFEDHIINLPIIGSTSFDKREKPIPHEWRECNVTISRKHGKYYASILFEYEDNREGLDPKLFHRNPKRDLNVLGLDYSSKSLYVDSNGLSAEYPKFYRKSQKRLRMLQKKRDRQKKGGKNCEKTCKKISKLHEHVANQRKDFLHKLSTSITKMYDVICVESINMQSIVRGLKLAKSTYDNSFGMFRDMLQYKQNRQPYHLLIYANRYYPSSKTCSVCGYINKDLALSDRVYICPECGNKIHRDINAAINLREEALRILNENIAYKQYRFKLHAQTTLGVSLLSDKVACLG